MPSEPTQARSLSNAAPPGAPAPAIALELPADLATPTEVNFRTLAGAWVLAATALRLFWISTLPLGNGEAYYYSWSRFLDWSYYDHPPLLTWMVKLFTLFGTSAFTVRLGPVLCSALFGLLLYRLAERLTGPRAAFFALVVVTALPVFMVSSFVLNPEAPLAPLWVAFLLAVEGMREGDEASRPIVAGALLGLAFLAKYTALLLVPATLLYFALSPHARRWLSRPSLYAGGALALALALPVLYWNHSRGWPTLQLHFSERNHLAGPVPGDNAFNDMVADASANGSDFAQRFGRGFMGQLLGYSPLLEPLLLLGLCVSAWRARRNDVDRFLAVFGLAALIPLFAAIVEVKDSELHWTMVAMMPAAIALGRLAEELRPRSRLFRWSLGGGFAVSGLLYLLITIHIHSALLIRMLPAKHYEPRADIINELIGWDQVRANVSQVVADTPGPVVLAGTQFALCGRLLFEMDDRPPVYCVSARRSEFDFIGRRHPPADATVIAITTDARQELPDELAERRCTLAQSVEIERGGMNVARYDIHRCPPLAPEIAATAARSRAGRPQ
ncbi:MAG TPA: glycosyltransferase family 39 protein [Myxococcales bacterium]|nr:glycosyltransferase family 39 protein [Myxococcales bacterium]